MHNDHTQHPGGLMERGGNDVFDTLDFLDIHPGNAAPLAGFSQDAEQYADCLLPNAAVSIALSHEIAINSPPGTGSLDNHSNHPSPSSIRVADFVFQEYIPHCIASRRSSARSHFRTVLNHILHPELVSAELSPFGVGTKKRLSTIPDWPYVDNLQLRQVDAGVIQRLTRATLERGYSTQMARQIRNVMSSILSYAIRNGYYTSPNPATCIALPAKPKKPTHILTLSQLVNALLTMVYPERHITLFLILAEMRVTEICGLQWKHINVSPDPRLVEGEVIPPKTIAVRNQIYRGEFTKVVGTRRRFVRIPDLLCTVLRELRSAQRLTIPESFALVSRNGTPIHPENIAARRLRPIGRSLEMPWLSWSVLVRTRSLLKAQLGAGLHAQLQVGLSASTYRQHRQGEIR